MALTSLVSLSLMQPMRILFITSSRIGDAVLSMGLLDHIVKTWPQARLTIVCGPLAASLFEGVPGLERLIPLKKQKNNRHWVALWKQVAPTRWDQVIDLRNSLVSRLIRGRRRYIHDRRIDPALHKAEQNAAVMKLDETPVPRLWPTPAQTDAARAMIPDGAPVLAVGPTANWLAKTWPPDRFIEIVSRVTAPGGLLPDARVAVFAAPGEEPAAREVLNASPPSRRIDMIARTDPGTAAAALQRCALYIGNDSGLMHCAAAAGIPTFGVFGPSWPHLYRPYGPCTAYARTPETFAELTAYDGYTAKTAPCLMTTLDVDTVMTDLTAFWQSLKA